MLCGETHLGFESLTLRQRTEQMPFMASVLFFVLNSRRDSKDERHRATVRWTVVTASDQAAAAARIESLTLRQRTEQMPFMASVLFFVLNSRRDSKDERHRATVRWTVVTASDQAAAAARIESLTLRQKIPFTNVGGIFYLFTINSSLVLKSSLNLNGISVNN